MSAELGALLEKHKREWAREYCPTDGGRMRHIRCEPSTAMAWIRKKQAQYAAADPMLSSSSKATVSLLGMGSNKPVVLFLVKCPHAEDSRRGRPFAAGCWRPLVDWADKHLPGYYYAAYLVPRHIPTGDPSLTGLTDQGAAAYGWYVRCLLETLRPKLLVPVGAGPTRAALGGFVARKMSALSDLRKLYASEHPLQLVLADPLQRLRVGVVPVIHPLQTTAGQRHGGFKRGGAMTAQQTDERREQQREQQREEQQKDMEDAEVVIDPDALPRDKDELWKVCFIQVKRSFERARASSRCKRRLSGDETCERLMQTGGLDPKPRAAKINAANCYWYSGIDRSNRSAEDDEAFEVVRVPLKLSEDERRACELERAGTLKAINVFRKARGNKPLVPPRRTHVPKLEKAARRTFTLEGGSRQVQARSGPMDQFVLHRMGDATWTETPQQAEQQQAEQQQAEKQQAEQQQAEQQQAEQQQAEQQQAEQQQAEQQQADSSRQSSRRATMRTTRWSEFRTFEINYASREHLVAVMHGRHGEQEHGGQERVPSELMLHNRQDQQK